MEKAVRVVCMTVVALIATSVLMTPSCEAAPPVKASVEIILDFTGGGDPELYVKEKEKFVGLCRNKNAGQKKRCRGNRITWALKVIPASAWQAGDDEVIIINAPGHPMCFGPDPVATFTEPNPTPQPESGLPAFGCTTEKYGTYWPYIIEFYRGGERKATTDPGGIIFP